MTKRTKRTTRTTEPEAPAQTTTEAAPATAIEVKARPGAPAAETTTTEGGTTETVECVFRPASRGGVHTTPLSRAVTPVVPRLSGDRENDKMVVDPLMDMVEAFMAASRKDALAKKKADMLRSVLFPPDIRGYRPPAMCPECAQVFLRVIGLERRDDLLQPYGQALERWQAGQKAREVQEVQEKVQEAQDLAELFGDGTALDEQRKAIKAKDEDWLNKLVSGEFSDRDLPQVDLPALRAQGVLKCTVPECTSCGEVDETYTYKDRDKEGKVRINTRHKMRGARVSVAEKSPDGGHQRRLVILCAQHAGQAWRLAPVVKQEGKKGAAKKAIFIAPLPRLIEEHQGRGRSGNGQTRPPATTTATAAPRAGHGQAKEF